MREHTGLFFRISYLDLEQVAQLPVECFTEFPIPSSSHFLAVLQISRVQKLYLQYRFFVALREAPLGIYVSASYCGNFLGNLGSRHRVRHCVCAGAHILVQLMLK